MRSAGAGDIERSRRLIRTVFDDKHVLLVDALRSSGEAVIDGVAIEDGQVVGHALCSRMQSPALCLGLGPVGVAPGSRNRGIGAALVAFAIEQARSQSWQAIFVLGAPAYYRRFGFDVETAPRFNTVYSKDHFMVLELAPDVLGGLPPDAIYAAPFAEL